MPAVTDHIRRDADAAAYAEVQLELGKYRRRFLEIAKGNIVTDLALAAETGQHVDGTAIGRAAAAAAISHYLGAEIHDPVDAAPAGPSALGTGDDPEDPGLRRGDGGGGLRGPGVGAEPGHLLGVRMGRSIWDSGV